MLITNQLKNQLKYQMSTLIKIYLTFCTIRFYSSADQLWLRVKKVADWVKYNIIYSKFNQDSKAYFIQYIIY